MEQGNSGTLTYLSSRPEWNPGAGRGAKLEIDWSQTYDIASRTSEVTFSNARITVLNTYKSAYVTCLLRANGEDIIRSRSFRGDFGTYINTGGVATQISYTGVGGWPRTITVRHNDDGTKSFTVSFLKSSEESATLPYITGTAGYWDFAPQDYIITLRPIPVTSTFTVSGTKIGSPMEFTISRSSSNFTHKVYYKHVDNYYTLLSENVGTSYTWNIPEGVGGQIPDAMSGSFILKVETYQGTTLLGEETKNVTLTVPNYSLTGSEWYSAHYDNTDTAAEGIAKPVKGYSKLVYSASSSGVTTRYGATLGAPTVTVNGSASQSGRTITSKSTTVTFRIADSRGKTLTESVTVTALDYTAPSLLNVTAKRCNGSGTDDDEGTYWYARATASVSSLEGANSYTMTAAIKQTGGSYGAENPLTNGVKSVFGGELSTVTSYVARITITDALNNRSTTEIPIQTMEVTFNAKTGGHGFAFGKTSETDYLLDVAWDERVHGDLTVDGNAKGRLLGLGEARALIYTENDVNDYTEFGVYGIPDGAFPAHWPGDTHGGRLVVYNSIGSTRQPGEVNQTVTQDVNTANGGKYTRIGKSGTGTTVIWGEWIAAQAEASHSTTANFCKYPDGTLIQWGVYTFNQSGTMQPTTNPGIYFAYADISLPMPFFDTNYVISGQSRYSNGYAFPLGGTFLTASTFRIYAYEFAARPLSDGLLPVRWQAIGRWK